MHRSGPLFGRPDICAVVVVTSHLKIRWPAATRIIRGCTVFGFLLVRDASFVWLVYMLAAVQLGISGFFFTARTAILPDLVESQGVGSANAITSATWSAMLALGAAAGGLVAGTLGSIPPL